MFNLNSKELETGSTPLPLGEQINNVKITNAEYVKGGNWEAISVTYTRGEASTTDRMFTPNEQWINPSPYITDDTKKAAMDRAWKTYRTQIYQVAKCAGLTPEQFDSCSATDFTSMAAKYCTLINSMDGGTLCWLKTTKNKDGYIAICRDSNKTTPFLERMEGEEACTLMYSDKQQRTLDKINETLAQDGVIDSTPATGGESWTKSGSSL